MLARLQKNPLIAPAATLWKYSEGFRGLVLLYIALSVAANIITLLQPLVFAWLLNVLQSAPPELRLSQCLPPLLTLACIPLCFWSLHGPSRIIEQRVGFFARSAYLRSIFGKTTELPMRWHRDHHSGETIDKVTRASDALGEFAARSFQVLKMLVTFVASFVILTVYMPIAGITMGAALCASVAAIVFFDRKLLRLYRTINDKYSRVNAAVQDYLTNIGTVISLRLEPCVNGELKSRLEQISPAQRDMVITNEIKWALTDSFMVGLVRVGILITYVSGVGGHSFEIGTFYALYEYLRRIETSFSDFSWIYADVITKGTRLLGVGHIESAHAALVSSTASATLPDDWKTLQISELTFRHEDDVQRTGGLQDVSLTLLRGKSYAIVGESGSGKSTLLSVIRGLVTADRAQITCDGNALPFGLVHLHHRAALVPQKPEIFSETIRFNITLGIESEETAILDAVDRARFRSVLNRLPKGLDTHIAEKGVNLSGGEGQRLALARGIFFAAQNGSNIILLDEPTSSVDISNEYEIYRSLISHYRERCVVSAMHRMSLLPLFDQVILMADGKIVERGTLHELLDAKGAFSELWDEYHLRLQQHGESQS